MSPPPEPPVTLARTFVRRHHGDAVEDPYAWLSDPADPAVIAHLEAENAYAEAVTAHLEPLRQEIVAEIRGRTQETDLSVPVSYRGWWYYARSREGLQYSVQCRCPVVPGQGRPAVDPEEPLAGEQVLVDGNAEAAGHGFFALGACEVDLAGGRVAYLVDTVGDERFRLRIRNIASGETVDESVSGAGYGLVWSADGRFVFYTRVDDAWRPHEVWRHEVGGPAESDVLVHRETDERFWMGLSASRDDSTLVIHVASKSTSEALLLDLADPTSTPRVVAPRREGLEYEVEPAGDGLLVVHNARQRDFGLSWAPPGATGVTDWVPVLQSGPGERIVGVDAFATHAVVSLRTGGLTALRVLPRTDRSDPAEAGALPEPGAQEAVVAVGEVPTAGHGDAETPAGAGGAVNARTSAATGQPYGPSWDVPVAETLYTIGLGDNPEWHSSAVRIVVESMLTPRTVAEVDLITREVTVLKRQPVLGGYDPSGYRQERVWVRAGGGVQVPVSIVCRADVDPGQGAPGILYGYGAYEIPLDPWFSIPRLSLLDRGVVLAVAHVRGGGELGRSWYEQGRLDRKGTSFDDLVRCAEHLVESGWVAGDRLGLQGGSAGGLLVGATLNKIPERFRVVLAQVPFVDALTTILDPSMPLTVPEWEEWGNPLADPRVYAYMRAYSPYENVRPAAYPAVLATTSLNDTRVSYAEPAKWVARLRELTRSDPATRPVLLRVEMEAGHGGRSGRYDAWEQYAWEMSFVLDQLGAGGRPSLDPDDLRADRTDELQEAARGAPST